MAYFRVNNLSTVPVHLALHQAGILWFHANNLAPAVIDKDGKILSCGYAEWDVGVGGYAFTVIPSNGTNQVDPLHENLAGVGKWVVGGLSVVIGAVGIALAIPTGGGSAVLSGMAIAGLTAAIASGVVVAADIIISGVSAGLWPATITDLYGPDGYNFEIKGGNIVGEYMPATKTIRVDKISPLSVHWHNNNTGATGTKMAEHS